MSIVKIQGVRKLKQTIDYIKQDTKSNDNLITTFDCDRDFIIEDFNSLYERRKNELRKETNNKAKMIIQSFDYRENKTPQEVHEIGVKLAENYLNGKHQFIVATHVDTDHLHNHIVFNEVRSDNLLMYDTSRRSTIDNLRLENDKISREYGLHIPKEKSHEDKITYINQRELKVKEKGISFKDNLENTIDKVIENSNDYEDFIQKMEILGFKSKDGKHLAFLNNDNNYFMRTKTLGINYTKNSIQYRIENKDFKIHKFNYTIETKEIDKSQEKFKNNYGLRKWATKQNIVHIQEISNLVFNEKKSLQEIELIQKSEEQFTKDIEVGLQEKDSILNDLEKKITCFENYKQSAGLISEYKNSDNKADFKRSNYSDFKKYDTAKKDLYLLKKNYGIENLDELLSYKEVIKKERNEVYSKYTTVQREQEKNKKQNKTR